MATASTSVARSTRSILAQALPSTSFSSTSSLWSTAAAKPVSRSFSATSTHRQKQEPSVSSQNAPETASEQQAAQRPKTDDDKWSRHRAQYNYDPFTLHPEPKHYTYPLVTARDLADRSTSAANKELPHASRPREVRMLARDFIHDSLYNPTYGYFSKQAVLLPDAAPETPFSSRKNRRQQKEEQAASIPDEFASDEHMVEEMGILRQSVGFDFSAIRSESEFMRLVEERYELFEQQISLLVQDKADAKEALEKSQRFEETLQAERAERRRLREQQEDQDGEEVASNDQTGTKTGSKSKPIPAYSAEGLELAQLRGRALAQAAQEGVQEREVQSMAAKQVWHTPTQIFRPWYGRAIARYLVAEYKLHNYPYDDLVVYEMGAGSGALAHDVLEYLEAHQPEVYTRTRYRIVEISPRLAEEQSRLLDRHIRQGRVEVINKSILEWDEHVPQPCFVIALEVFDNLAHDVVRYSTEDWTPYQAVVSIDETGDMHELFEPVQDPLINKYLHLDRHQLQRGGSSFLPAPLRHSWLQRMIPRSMSNALAKFLPFYPNLTQRHYLPTSSLVLLENLHTYFPQHRMIMSDFDSLPDTCQGVNAPVVQTRYDGAMIPVTTYMVLQGHFDIFFPTNFEDLRNTYLKIVSQGRTLPRLPQGAPSANSSTPQDKSSYFYHNWHVSDSPDYSGGGGGGGPRKRKNVKVLPHADFLARYAETDRVTLRDGSNPLLSWYQNASWFLS